MFVDSDVHKRKMEDAYRKGIAKARETGALEGFFDDMASLVIPDSMGTEEYQSYKQGYRDYVTGKIADKSPAPKKSEIRLTDLEKAWYGLCNNSEFIRPEIVRRYSELLSACGNTAALVVGLSDFSATTCPNCAAAGQYKIHFLGQLNHPECGTKWYMGPGSYIGFQLASVLNSGIRTGGSMKQDSDRKGERGGWLSGIIGFMMAAALRFALACILIPIQAIVSLSQSRPTRAREVSS